MSCAVLLQAAALFLGCLGLHVLAWRLRTPRRHVPALLAVFLLPAAAWGARLWALQGGLEAAAVLLLHLALSCAYIQTYPAAQAMSPSLWILLIARRFPGGASREEIRAGFDARSLVGDRIEDLLRAGLVEEDGRGRLRLGRRGAALLPAFAAMRRLLGLRAGEG